MSYEEPGFDKLLSKNITPDNPKSPDEGIYQERPVLFIRSGLSTERPVTGERDGSVYYEEDTQILKIWSGSSWYSFVRDTGFHKSTSITYISGTGTAGTDNTAMNVKTLVLPANSLKQVGDRMRIRTYWTGDTGSPITGSVRVNNVLVSHTTDAGAATLQLNESWLHYISDTRANIIENEAGALGALSAPNTAGFDWDAPQNIIFSQDQIANNRTILYALIVDIFPKGT